MLEIVLIIDPVQYPLVQLYAAAWIATIDQSHR